MTRGDDHETSELTTAEALAVLGPVDLNLVVIEEIWGENSVDWLISQYALAATPTAERAERLALTGTAPVFEFPNAAAAAPRRISELRAA